METLNQEQLRKELPVGMIAVNEIFYSIQGEGKFSGTPMVFIRMNFCNVGCKFCDTKYTWKNISHNKFYKPQEVVMKVKELSQKCKSVCITGGEPLEQYEGLVELCKLLNLESYKVHLETSGSMLIPEDLKKHVFWIVCSPKNFNGLNFLSKIDEIKILVKKTHTIDRIRNFVNKFKRKIWVSIQPIEPNPFVFGNFDGLSDEQVLFMKEQVQGARNAEQEEWVLNCKQAIELCKQSGWHLSFQIHKQLNIR